VALGGCGNMLAYIPLRNVNEGRILYMLTWYGSPQSLP